MPNSFKNENNELNIAVISAIVIIFILSIIPFVQNFKYNDNHLNWLNHDYGKNLMISTEQDSVFMTEGGDNQVFSTLYFMYAEKLRPDLSPYDQKGNIFKRIYGDMRYIDPQTLSHRMQLVDTHLFAGEEPFYVDIRDRADPYFIPYWQGRRPVYLTWERPEPWTLGSEPSPIPGISDTSFKTGQKYGDYYYKRYGIMYKVQDIAYRFVDYLEIKKEMTLAQAQSQLSTWLHRTVDISFTIDKINQMVQKGCLSLSGNLIRFIKMYDSPHEGDYFKKLLLRWKDIPNAKYWDYLSREIMINYDYQMGEVYREEIKELQEKKNKETRPAILADIDKRIKENWKMAMDYYDDAIYVGDDSLSTLHNLSVVFMKNEVEPMYEKAHNLLTKALTLYKNSWGTYSLMFTFLINDFLEHPDNEAKNLKEAKKWFDQLKKELVHYRSAKGDYTKHQLWKNFGGIEAYLKQFEQLPTASLLQADNQFSAVLKNNPSSISNDIAKAVIYHLYSRGIPFQYQPYIEKADKYINALLIYKQNDPLFLSEIFNICVGYQKYDLAYPVGKRLLSVLGKNSPDPYIYYLMGVLSYNKGNKAESRQYTQTFLDRASSDKQAIKYQDAIQRANELLKILK